MIEIEIVSNNPFLEKVKASLEDSDDIIATEFHQRGTDGHTSVSGLLVEVSKQLVGPFFETLKTLISKNEDVIVSVDNIQVTARNVDDFDRVLTILGERGLIGRGKDDA